MNLPNEIPGIRSLFMCRPETAAQLDTLVQTLLHNPHPMLNCGERELIAAYVSRLNTCKYCCNIHGSLVDENQLGDNSEMIIQVLTDPETAPISNKMKALLNIADKVHTSRKKVTADDIALAIKEGATDMEIYDTRFIADAFCMYNCYVAGLAAYQPDDVEQFIDEEYSTASF